MAQHQELLELTAEIVTAHVGANAVAVDLLPRLIKQVFDALADAPRAAAEKPRPEPSVPINKSVFSAHIVCLDCGRKFSMLKRHLMIDHKLSPGEYRQKWGLPSSYPVVAPEYAKRRSAMAKKFGLGRTETATFDKGRRSTGRAAR